MLVKGATGKFDNTKGVFQRVDVRGLLLLTRVKSNPSMDK